MSVVTLNEYSISGNRRDTIAATLIPPSAAKRIEGGNFVVNNSPLKRRRIMTVIIFAAITYPPALRIDDR